MTAKPLPKGYKLTPEAPEALTAGYDHWTVGDFIRMLSDYPQDARVWIAEDFPDDGDVTLRPLESIIGTDREVIL